MVLEIVIKNKELCYIGTAQVVSGGARVKLSTREIREILNLLAPTEGGWEVEIKDEGVDIDPGERRIIKHGQGFLF